MNNREPGQFQGDTPPTPARRVLVADDDERTTSSLAFLLRLAGREVQCAHDGWEAVESAAAFRPHLILMDVRMPNLDGLDATRRIREELWGRDVFIVALTDWGQSDDIRLLFEAGCDGHLVKPVPPVAIQSLLTSIGSARARRQQFDGSESMPDERNHALTYNYVGNVVAARCACGGWEWGTTRSKDLFPLDAIIAIGVEHRRHVEAAESSKE